MKRYRILRTNGLVETHTTSIEWDLKKLQKAVGGNIQILPRPEDFGLKGTVYVNEDGKNEDLPVNPLLAPSDYDVILGDVLVEESI